MTTAAVPAFIAAAADAWGRGDADAVADLIGLPQMIAGAAGTEFIEEDNALDDWIARRLGVWRAIGVVAASAVVDAVEELPDDAARVTSRWTLTGGDGAVRLDFVAVDTLARDEGEWYYVVTDVAGEDAALAGRS